MSEPGEIVIIESERDDEYSFLAFDRTGPGTPYVAVTDYPVVAMLNGSAMPLTRGEVRQISHALAAWLEDGKD